MPRRVSRRAFALGLGTLAACRHKAQPGRDRPLVVLFGPYHNPRSAEALRAHVAQASGLQLELRAASSTNAAIDDIELGRADAALLPLFDFLYCADVFGVVPVAQLLRGEGRDVQAGDLVVKTSSASRDVHALRGARVGYVDRYSVTGFILPAALLREAGVEVTPVWLDSHEAVVSAVRDGRVDAGATWAGHVKAEPDLRVLASTGTIANEPVFARSEVPVDVRDALRAALVAERDPGALAGLADATGLRAPPAGTYEAALAKIKAAGQRVEDMVPGGWARANDHRRPLWTYAP
jgi:phosphonate transport system substrate-binding protein